MNQLSENILEYAKVASLKIFKNDETFFVGHYFQLKDKSTIGLLLFALGGLFMIFIPFIKTSDLFSKIVSPIIGVTFLVLAFLSIVDNLQIILKS